MLGLLLKLIPTYGNITRMLAFAVGMVYPTLESFKAIESKGQGDDTQWLTYWVCYATLMSLESLAWGLLIWLPFYRLLRVAAMAWLALPQLRGATLVYEQLVRPFLLVAVDKLNDLPALEPYLRDFLPPAGKKYTVSVPSSAQGARPASPPALNFDRLKQEAVAKVEETFEKAKQQQAAASDEDAAQSLSFQPLKQHAT